MFIFQEKKLFKTFSDFQETFLKELLQEGHHFSILNSRIVRSEDEWPSALKYRRIKYCCIHYGKRILKNKIRYYIHYIPGSFYCSNLQN